MAVNQLIEAPLEFDPAARATAKALAVTDSRFEPELIAAAVRRVVNAWAAAVEGDDKALVEFAYPGTRRSLLHPGEADGGERLFVRDLRVSQIRLTSLTPHADTALLNVALTCSGRRFVEDVTSGELVSGSRDDEMSFIEVWVLSLHGPAPSSWHLGLQWTRETPDTGEFVSRRETPEEHRERLERAGLVKPRSFQILCRWGDEAMRAAGEVTVAVERTRAPTREEAQDLVMPQILYELMKRGAIGVQPQFPLIEVRELIP
jgi:hypothetical protein